MEEEVFNLIQRIASEHCFKTFGYLDVDDLKNEIWVICLEQLKDFKEDRGKLEHFLRVAVRTRLVNKFKDITKSVRSPCTRCPFYRPNNKLDCKKFKTHKEKCFKWKNYQLSIESRNSLLNPSESKVERNIGDNSITKMITDEVKEIIKENIAHEFVNDFEILISAGRLPVKRQKKLQEQISKIIFENERIAKILKNEKEAT
jgi:DNA-directed RNA polymerase specialized sigma24 family protein